MIRHIDRIVEMRKKKLTEICYKEKNEILILINDYNTMCNLITGLLDRKIKIKRYLEND